MEDRDWLAGRFEEHRPRLRAVAYRMLGSTSEADDAVQETWLRLSRSDTSGVENLGGWLTTVVGRVSLDMLRSRRSRREGPLEEPLGQPPDARVPQPSASRGDGTDPEQEALLADSVGLALLVVLDTLNPAERLAFVLHDMFSVPFDEIAPIVGRSPSAARQLASRARRRRVRGAPTALDADLTRQREVVDAFLAAARWRLRRAARGARPRRRAAIRWRSHTTGCIEGAARCGSRGRAGADLLEVCPVRTHTTGAGERSRGSRLVVPGRTAVFGHGLHGQGREDRRDRRDRRPRAP
jgi:RNA polymerase sigma factor (sigma-70 family)